MRTPARPDSRSCGSPAYATSRATAQARCACGRSTGSGTPTAATTSRPRSGPRARTVSWARTRSPARACTRCAASTPSRSTAPAPPRPDAVEAEVARALVRLDLLRELGHESAANFEVERLKRHFDQRDGALYALAEAFNARGFTLTGIRIGWDIYRREGAWNLRLLRIIYPFPYRDLILAEAAERGLDPFLVAGLIRQESMFNPTIVSPAGAIGLMQIMPATGRSLARATDLGS